MRHLNALRFVLAAPRARREDVVAWQTRQLRRLILHAYERVPFYRELFDAHGVKPRDIRTLDDLSRLPLTRKEDFVDRPEREIVADGTRVGELVARRTSGSSGPVFTMWRSPAEELVSEILQLRIRRSYGLRPRDRQVVSVMDARTLKSVGRLHRIADRLGIHRTHALSPLLPPEEYVRRLLEIRPQLVLGLAGPLARAASFLPSGTGRAWRPRCIVTTGEVLTPRMRAVIGAAFGAPVYDKYVCAELGHVAWECPSTGQLHTCDDHLVVEVVRDGRPVAPGERGELVATALNYRAMPFIRYRLADVVTRGPDRCACGQPFATIRAVQGRMIDYFHLPDGRVIHPYQLGGAVQERVTWVREFQLIQERRDLIVANIVARAKPSAEELARLSAGTRSLLGEGVELRIEFVDRIDWGRTGKLRLFRSRVGSEYDNLDWDALGSSA